MNAEGETNRQSACHKIVFGDSRSMRELADRSVHLIVTSPPYWQLKDYENRQQIGFHDSYEEYINNLNLVWSECHRVLHDGCRLCVNIGDQFARSVYYGRYKIIPIRTEIIRFCETIGFDYMGAIIWQKVTTCNTTGGGTVMGSFPYPRNGILKLDYEFILLFKKPGKPPRVSQAIKQQAALTTEEWNTFFSGHWRFAGEKQGKHLAAFPVELPRRLIRMFTFPGETVLDPFLGSGTTSVAAQECQRRSAGYEINRDNARMILERLGSDPGSLFGSSGVEIISQTDDLVFDCEAAYRTLPYLFKDPVRLERKAEAQARTFGSRVSTQTPKREKYYGVKRVIAPNLIELRDGSTVRLLGICTQAKRRADAVQYLHELLKGQRVYLRSDQIPHDSNGNKLCYVYLSNRTFVNARLIKEGLAGIDEEFPFEKIALFKGYGDRLTSAAAIDSGNDS